MKYEFGAEKPEQFRQYWPGQYDFFSYMEYACAIPQPLFAITTRKADGKPNINFHSWSCFQGDKGGFFAILAGLCQHTHTYENLRRDGAFCVNFLSKRYYDALIRTVEHNGPAEDEFAVGGFIEETAWTVAVPRIAESFLTLECKCVTDRGFIRRGADCNGNRPRDPHGDGRGLCERLRGSKIFGERFFLSHSHA